MRTYEATVANAASVRRVQEAKRAIEKARGTLRLAPSGTPGMTIVVLTLPDQYTPEMFIPDVPFYRSA